MWFNLTLLLLAVAGFVALFLCKAMELTGKETPLARLRERGDSFVEKGFTANGQEMRAQCVVLCRRTRRACRALSLSAGSSALAFVHTLTLRIGEYLRKRKALPPYDTKTKGSVSFYLKNVLEYKRRVQSDEDPAVAERKTDLPQADSAKRNDID